MTPALNSVVRSDALALCRELPEASVDMILTSPPYDNLRKYGGYSWDFEGIAHESYRVLKQGGVMVWVVGDSVVDGSETLSSFKQALYFKEVVGFRVHDTMIWQKQRGANPNSAQNPVRYQSGFEYMFVLSKGIVQTANLIHEPNKYAGQKNNSSQRQRNGKNINYSGLHIIAENSPLSNIWYIPTGFRHSTTDVLAFQHPAIFPEKLAERHILTWSNPGELVLDFFMGSGTVALVARALGRNYIGGDLNPDYVALCEKRLSAPYTPPLFDLDAPAAPKAETLPLWTEAE